MKNLKKFFGFNKTRPGRSKSARGVASGWCMTPLSSAQALEPRILLDAAGAVSIAEPADTTDPQDTAAGNDPGNDLGGEDTSGTPATEEAQAPVAGLADDGGEQESGTKREIAFIDPNVRDWQSLAEGIRPGVEVVVIDADDDGFARMAEVLGGREDLDAVHIFSDGAAGQVRMGTALLEAGTLDAYTASLQAIQGALREGGDVLVYGCSVAGGDAGGVFLGTLASLTGSDVAASDDPTGAAEQGGDWDLERASGPIEAECALGAAATSGYGGLLGAATDIEFSNYDIAAGNSLVNGLGGASGFDTKVLAADLTPKSLDDGCLIVDISSVFGSGLKFGNTTYNGATQFYVGTNGYVTFGHGNTSFSAVGISGYNQGPMVAAQFDDIDLSDAPAQSPGGNSTGTHSLYYDIEAVNKVVTITYDDVGPYGGTAGGGDPNTGNAFQIRLHHINGSDFAIELRYENISWINGNSGLPTGGWTAGDQTNYGEVTGSGTSAFLNLESASNISQNGVFVWEVRDGKPLQGQNVIPEDASAGTFVSAIEITDADVETHTCSLVDDDGGRFEIYSDGGTWKVRTAAGASFDYETATTSTIRVKATGDTDGLSYEKDLTINISDVNEAPTAADKTVTTNEDTAHTFAVSDFNFSDQDSGAALSKVKITSLESNGTLAYNNSGTWQDVTLNQEITKADIDAGKLRFTPVADANGAGYDSFGFKVSDGTNYSASAYTMTTDVTAVNDAPTSADKTVTSNEDTVYTFEASDFSFSDVDVGAALSKVKITSLESNGTLAYNNGGTWQDVTLNQEITKADIDAGKLRFTPVAGASGSNYDSFGFKVSDGTDYSAAAYSVTVDVADVNGAPTDIALSAANVAENDAGAVAGTLSATDPDAGDTATFSIVNDASGLFEISGTTLKIKDGSSADYETASSHNLTIRATDAAGVAYDESFTVTVTDVNEASTAFVPHNAPPNPAQGTAAPRTDISFQPTREGNQVVEGIVGTVEPGDTMTPGRQLFGETRSGTATGNTPVTPSRGGESGEGAFAAGSFGTGMTALSPFTFSEAGPTGPFAAAGEGATPNLSVHMGISTQVATAGETIRFEIPDDAFAVANENVTLTFQAMQADGSPLPQWLSFFPETGFFTGIPPAGAERTTVEITVIVSDGMGNEATVTFKIEVAGMQGMDEDERPQEIKSEQTSAADPAESLTTPMTAAVNAEDATPHREENGGNLAEGDGESYLAAPEDGGILLNTLGHGRFSVQGKPSFSTQLQAAGIGEEREWQDAMLIEVLISMEERGAH